jgi:hypothetical protein
MLAVKFPQKEKFLNGDATLSFESARFCQWSLVRRVFILIELVCL